MAQFEVTIVDDNGNKIDSIGTFDEAELKAWLNENKGVLKEYSES